MDIEIAPWISAGYNRIQGKRRARAAAAKAAKREARSSFFLFMVVLSLGFCSAIAMDMILETLAFALRL